MDDNLIYLRILYYEESYFHLEKYYPLDVNYLMPTTTLNEFLKSRNTFWTFVWIINELAIMCIC